MQYQYDVQDSSMLRVVMATVIVSLDIYLKIQVILFGYVFSVLFKRDGVCFLVYLLTICKIQFSVSIVCLAF